MITWTRAKGIHASNRNQSTVAATGVWPYSEILRCVCAKGGGHVAEKAKVGRIMRTVFAQSSLMLLKWR